MTLSKKAAAAALEAARANRGPNARTLVALADMAAAGCRLVLVADPKDKTLWAGLGNRSGLHDYARIVLTEKWDKSGARFQAKLAKLPGGSVIKVQDFRNIDRDRGRWVTVKTVRLVTVKFGGSK